MKCNQCGHEVDVENWIHCPNCGGGFVDERIVRVFVNFFRSKRNIYLVLSVVALILGAFFWKIYRTNQEISRKNAELRAYANKEAGLSAEWKPKEKVMPLTADERNPLGTLKVSSQNFTQIRIELEAEGVTEKKTETLSIKPETADFDLGAPYSIAGYQKLKEGSQKVPLRIRVFQLGNTGEKMVLEQETPLFFNSIYEIIWKEKGENNTPKVLRLVDKNDPQVAELVQKAAKYVRQLGGKSEAMTGFLTHDPEEVKRQVEAIFLAMNKDYQLKYVFAPFSYNGSGIQLLKDPSRVLMSRSGICIDLSLLMAAAFEYIGLDPVLVFLDDHVWPGVELGYKSGNFIFIEATALGKTPQEAVGIATKNWQLLQKKDTPVSYDLVRVVEERSKGILPISTLKAD